MVVLFVGLILICADYAFAGPGGHVYLVNLSGFDWKLNYSHAKNLKHWDFPEVLKHKETHKAYVEYNSFYLSMGHGKVQYELVGTRQNNFMIFARALPLRIEVVYTNLEIDGKPKGSLRNLGWKHDGDMNVILVNSYGNFTGTNLDASNWMRNNIKALGNRTLKDISIPGSHDSGMNRVNGHTAFGKSCNTENQSKTILEQLQLGIRYFDIRPVIGNGGEYLTGHYTHIPGSWQGANGQSLDSVITDINRFTKYHDELIILYVSHTLNTDVGSTIYRVFNEKEWETLFQKLDTINFLYHNKNPIINLSGVTLNDFTRRGSRSAVVIILDGDKVSNRTGKGYFLKEKMTLYDEYSNTNYWGYMKSNQIDKMNNFSKDHYFVLNWILTQSGGEAAFCTQSIKDLAKEANKHLGHFIYEAASKFSFPNVILTDNVIDPSAAELAIAVNYKM